MGESDQEGFLLIFDESTQKNPQQDSEKPSLSDRKKIDFNDVVFVRLNPTEEEFALLAERFASKKT